jgi:hypothetical protein
MNGMSYLYRAPALLDSSDLSDQVWLSTVGGHVIGRIGRPAW